MTHRFGESWQANLSDFKSLKVVSSHFQCSTSDEIERTKALRPPEKPTSTSRPGTEGYALMPTHARSLMSIWFVPPIVVPALALIAIVLMALLA
jgi:hypothetical protein